MAQDVWQADYSFGRPIDAIVFGSAVVDYRRTAWKPLTSGIELISQDGQERLQGISGSFRHVRVHVTLYKQWDVDRYVPMSRHSNGGTDVYLGYFMGEAIRDTYICPLQLRVQLQPMKNESVFTTALSMPNPETYAHFGKSKPLRYGGVRAIIDPRIPIWMREILRSTIPQAQTFYTQSFKRQQNKDLLLMFGTGDLTTPGRSIKGGALAGQLFYKVDGAAIKEDTSEARRKMQFQVFHELAHIWQGLPWPHSVVRYESAWITEGGAEALSLAGLKETGLWSSTDVDNYGARLEADCEADQTQLRNKTAILNGRNAYACGYLQFRGFDIPASELWRTLLNEAMRTKQPYSQEMIDRVINQAESGYSDLRSIRQ